MSYLPTIGLEIHSELKTDSKMFCSCPNDPDGKAPNTNVCPVCLGHPGTLPVANGEAIKKVRIVGLALGSEIMKHSKFDRKNYFYPDLPKGYQISQYDEPLCLGGFLEVDINGREPLGQKKTIRITRVHLEEDTGKLLHPAGSESSLVDFNRGGVPLMELVTEPDINNAAEAREFVKELQLILRYLGVSDADMEKGKLRVEVNISLSPEDNGAAPKKLGTKVEIKNLNSLKSVEGSVAYEVKRQSELLGAGEKIIQETRGWDDVKGVTFSQREKEEANDYRYFPEPDIPPLEITDEEIKKLRVDICELPANKRKRFIAQYGLDRAAVEIFVANRNMANYFERAASELENWVNDTEGDSSNTEAQSVSMARLCSNYLTSDVQGYLKGKEFSQETFPVTAENFAEFIKLIYKGEISSKIAKNVLAEMAAGGGDPTQIIENKGLSQVNDEKQIAEIIEGVLGKNPKAIEDYKKGKGNALQFLIGQALGASQGKANPDILRKVLLERLAEK